MVLASDKCLSTVGGLRSAPLVATFALGCCGALVLTLSRPAVPRVEAASGQAQTTAGMSDDERLARATCSTCLYSRRPTSSRKMPGAPKSCG